MNRNLIGVNILIAFSLMFLFSRCSKESKFPTEKRFWTTEDYSEVIRIIGYRTPEGEEYPRFSNSETEFVIRKLLDKTNYEVVLDDPELGMNYKNEVAQKFFEQYRDLVQHYAIMDIQDKYIYPEELIEIEKFGLDLQIKYFKIGNDRIKEQSDSPESERTLEVLKSNEQTIIKNFNGYLDNINDEKSFGEYAPNLAEGISVYFPKLHETFPTANFSVMINKAKLMLNKTKVEENKSALIKLIEMLKPANIPESN
jgi:hypothetical protein